jgi:hypothetical protein
MLLLASLASAKITLRRHAGRAAAAILNFWANADALKFALGLSDALKKRALAINGLSECAFDPAGH